MRSVGRDVGTLALGQFDRPESGPEFEPVRLDVNLPLTKQRAWQSNGGALRSHPARAFPFTLEVPVPETPGRLRAVSLVGVFGLYSERGAEQPGSMGAVVEVGDPSRVLARAELIYGRHYAEPDPAVWTERSPGDGTFISPIGTCVLDRRHLKLERLTIDVPTGPRPTAMRFRDLGSPASFLIYDVLFEFEEVRGCPFHSTGGGVALADLGAIIRVGDRVRLRKSLEKLERAIMSTEDLDEARGEALTFIAVVTAATLEMGGGRQMHKVQLQSARELDRLEQPEAIARFASSQVAEIAEPLMAPKPSPMDVLIDRALEIVNRNFARNLTDRDVAEQLGISTSHFRYLFREATGQPFHKYLIALRLERAKQLLVNEGLPVSEAAAAVGFTGLSHFSRAFARRFAASPSSLRRAG